MYQIILDNRDGEKLIFHDSRSTTFKVYDAVCEFTNCVNGLFASKLSYEGINIDMLPPLFYTDAEIVSEHGFYSVPLIINSKKVNLIVGINCGLVIK